MIDVTEILVHWHAGRSKNEMAGSLGVDRKTLRKYIAPAEAAGIVPGGPAKSEEEWAELVRGWFPQLADTRLRQVTWPAISAHHDYIVEQLKAGVRMSTIHQRLRDEHGLAVSVQSFRRYVTANLPEETRRSQVTVWDPVRRPSPARYWYQLETAARRRATVRAAIPAACMDRAQASAWTRRACSGPVPSSLQKASQAVMSAA